MWATTLWEHYREGGVRLVDRLRRRWGWAIPRLLDLVGVGSLAALALLCVHLGEYDPFLYRGGLGLVGLASALVIMACVHPQSQLGVQLLGWGALRWIGLRSYGIYLWHWPIFMLTREQLDVSIGGGWLVGVRLGLTLGLAELSYRYVERPIRRGALGRAWGELKESRGYRRRRLSVLWAGAAVPGVVFLAAIGVAVAQAKVPDPPSYISTKRLHIEASAAASGTSKTLESSAPDAGASAAAPQSAAVREEAASTARATRQDSRPRKARGRTATAPSSGTLTVTAIGDSAMLGAVDALQYEIPNLAIIDARGSRQAPEAISVLQQLRATGRLGDVVIVHIGNNGVFSAEEFDEMMRVLTGVRKVLVVNVTVPDGYSSVPNNEVLAEGVGRYSNRAVLVDWYSASAGHPEYFWDGIHLTPDGAYAYADLIATVYEEQGR